MVTDRLAEGAAVGRCGERRLHVRPAEFFRTKDNGFEYEADVSRFLDALTKNEKYPFST